MAIYDFKCDGCGKVMIDVMLPITHTKEQLPVCCNSTMGYFITQAPMVHWVDPVIEPFRSIATPDKPILSTTRQIREYKARHDLLDANEVIGKPPSNAEQEREVAEMMKTIEAITPTKEQAKEMKARGIDLDITE